jgi:hypothetical protein
VVAADFGEAIQVTMADGTVHTHRRTSTGWELEVLEGSSRSKAALGGRTAIATPGHPERSAPPSRSASDAGERSAPPVIASLILPAGKALTLHLGEQHYRRSDQTWSEAGKPTAIITLQRTRPGVGLTITVPHSERTFAPVDAVNRYDNEHPDINGDGVQLHVRTPNGLAGWTLIPEPETDHVRVRAIGVNHQAKEPDASWRPTANGYEMTIGLAELPLAVDVIVNEMPSGRERRRGQLVLSGAAGEFIYLRGDRHEEERLIPLRADDE